MIYSLTLIKPIKNLRQFYLQPFIFNKLIFRVYYTILCIS